MSSAVDTLREMLAPRIATKPSSILSDWNVISKPSPSGPNAKYHELSDPPSCEEWGVAQHPLPETERAFGRGPEPELQLQPLPWQDSYASYVDSLPFVFGNLKVTTDETRLESAVDELDAQICVARDELRRLEARRRSTWSDLYAKRGAHAPISGLPDDLLEHIFLLASAELYMPTNNKEFVQSTSPLGPRTILTVPDVPLAKREERTMPGQIRFSHVCRRWRAVSLGCAPLWSRLIISPYRGVELLGMMLSRSKKAPLRLTFFNHCKHERNWHSVTDILNKYILPRLISCSVEGCDCFILHIIPRLVAAPKLQELNISAGSLLCRNFSYVKPITTAAQDWISVETQTLTSVSLMRMKMPLCRFPLRGLSSLHLEFPLVSVTRYRPSPSEFLTILQSCPDVVDLALETIEFHAISVGADEQPILFSKLKTCSLSTRGGRPSWIRLLHMPALARLKIVGTQESSQEPPIDVFSGMPVMDKLTGLYVAGMGIDLLPGLLVAPNIQALYIILRPERIKVLLEALTERKKNVHALAPQLRHLGLYCGGQLAASDSLCRAVKSLIEARNTSLVPLVRVRIDQRTYGVADDQVEVSEEDMMKGKL